MTDIHAASGLCTGGVQRGRGRPEGCSGPASGFLPRSPCPLHSTNLQDPTTLGRNSLRCAHPGPHAHSMPWQWSSAEQRPDARATVWPGSSTVVNVPTACVGRPHIYIHSLRCRRPATHTPPNSMPSRSSLSLVMHLLCTGQVPVQQSARTQCCRSPGLPRRARPDTSSHSFQLHLCTSGPAQLTLTCSRPRMHVPPHTPGTAAAAACMQPCRAVPCCAVHMRACVVVHAADQRERHAGLRRRAASDRRSCGRRHRVCRSPSGDAGGAQAQGRGACGALSAPQQAAAAAEHGTPRGGGRGALAPPAAGRRRRRGDRLPAHQRRHGAAHPSPLLLWHAPRCARSVPLERCCRLRPPSWGCPAVVSRRLLPPTPSPC